MKISFLIFGILASVISTSFADPNERMVSEIKTCVEKIVSKYGNTRFTFMLSSDPSVNASQAEILQLATLREQIEEKERQLEDIQAQVVHAESLFDMLNKLSLEAKTICENLKTNKIETN